MALTDQQKEGIRQEEMFRHELRKELAGQKPPPSIWDRLSSFGESKVGFWLLTSVLAGALVWASGEVHAYRNREEIAKKEAIQRTHRDVDVVIKMHPMLTSDKQPVVAAAVKVLQEMARNDAVDGNLVKIMVDSMLVSTVAAGSGLDANDQTRMQAETVLANVADTARLTQIQKPALAADPAPAPAPSAASALLEAKGLPPRLYIQVAGDDDRERAALMRPALHKAGFLVPGVERVKGTPSFPEIRFCDGKIDAAQPENLRKVVDPFFTEQVKLVVLHPSLCTKVRENHFELWFPRRA